MEAHGSEAFVERFCLQDVSLLPTGRVEWWVLLLLINTKITLWLCFPRSEKLENPWCQSGGWIGTRGILWAHRIILHLNGRDGLSNVLSIDTGCIFLIPLYWLYHIFSHTGQNSQLSQTNSSTNSLTSFMSKIQKEPMASNATSYFEFKFSNWKDEVTGKNGYQRKNSSGSWFQNTTWTGLNGVMKWTMERENESAAFIY